MEYRRDRSYDLLILIYINDLESGVVSHILKFADDVKIFGN